MPYIYKPKGRALEYSPWALNIYTGCDHECTYCYNRHRFPIDDPRIREIDLLKLEEELKKPQIDGQVLFSFVGDPYCHAEMRAGMTRDVLRLFLKHEVPVAILTKGGMRAARDVELLAEMNAKGLVKIGATLSWLDDEKAREFEKNSAAPSERLAMLEFFHSRGFVTWVSVEPVIDPDEAINAITAALPYVDQFRIGKLNHDPEREAQIDWVKFLRRVVGLLEPMDKQRSIYIKKDLRLVASSVYLPPGWDDMTKGWIPRDVFKRKAWIESGGLI